MYSKTEKVNIVFQYLLAGGSLQYDDGREVVIVTPEDDIRGITKGDFAVAVTVREDVGAPNKTEGHKEGAVMYLRSYKEYTLQDFLEGASTIPDELIEEIISMTKEYTGYKRVNLSVLL